MTEFTPARLTELKAVAEAATEGPWIYNGYSAILTKERPDPIDGLSFDDWADQLAEGHTAEFHGGCDLCGTERPKGCNFAPEWYRRDNSGVASVPAAYGDTAIGQNVSNANHIAAFDPPTTLALIAALEAKTAEVEELQKVRADSASRIDALSANAGDRIAREQTVTRELAEWMKACQTARQERDEARADRIAREAGIETGEEQP